VDKGRLTFLLEFVANRLSRSVHAHSNFTLLVIEPISLVLYVFDFVLIH
jgi:hypothetical protein